jgi:Helicase associated domain
MLESLRGWRWAEPDWDERFARVWSFAAARGRLPARTDPAGAEVYRWLATQRERWRRGELSADERDRLESLPGWRWEPRLDPLLRGVGLLRRFAAREGHVQVPAGHVEEGLRLDRFASNLRRRHREEMLSDEARALLATVPGWHWTTRDEAQWERSFRALVAFAERHGHLRIPRGHRERGVRLDAWAYRQRQAWARGTLPAERRARLEAVPGWSWRPGEEPRRPR